jgi:hypothetical protein
MENVAPDYLSMKFAGTTVHIDRMVTVSLYRGPDFYAWCQCDNCSNFNQVMQEFYPPQMAAFLKQLGIDPHDPAYLPGVSSKRAPKGMVRYDGHYRAIGKIEGEARTGRRYLDEGCWVWADTKGRQWHSSDFLEGQSGNTSPPRLLIQFSLIVPWVLEVPYER